jgi:hypothetical protein
MPDTPAASARRQKAVTSEESENRQSQIANRQSGWGRSPPLPCPKQNCCNSTTARRTHGQDCTDRGYRRFPVPFRAGYDHSS